MSIRMTLPGLLIALTAGLAFAQKPITYVDADSTGPEGTVTGNTQYSSFFAFDQWRVRDLGVGGDVYQFRGGGSQDGTDPLELVTTINGLTPGTSYNFYAFFWDDTSNTDWYIDASLTGPDADPSEFTTYSNATLDNLNGPVYEAAELPFSNLSEVNTTNELVVTDPGEFQVIELQSGLTGNDESRGGSGNTDLLAAHVGTLAAPASGSASIYIRNVSVGNRVWYDGVGYQESGGTIGDTNNDGNVDITDYNTIASQIGGLPVVPGTGGDVFGDGVVDLKDFQVWQQRRNDQMNGGLANGVNAAPEPGAAALATLFGLFLAGMADRRAE